MTLSASDRAALRELSERYAAGADDRDLACVTALFATDGVLVVPDPPSSLEPVMAHEGRAGITAGLAALDTTLATTHVIASASYEATDHGARGRVRCIAHHVLPGRDGLVDLVWFLHYDDEYTRATSDSAWQIAHRAVTIDWIEKHRVSTSRAVAPGREQS